MSIEVKCPGCNKRYAVADQFAGKKAKCKACGSAMQVPKPVAPPPPPPDELDFDALAAMEGSAAVDESAPVAVAPPPVPPPASAVPGRRPMPVVPLVTRKSGGSGFRLGFHLNRLTIAMLVIGGMLIFFGFKEQSLASVSASTPQSLTCAQLEKSGYGNNAFVRVSGFKAGGGFVYQKRNGSDTNWSLVWVPIVSASQVTPLNGAAAPGLTPKIKVIVKSNNWHNQADVESFARSSQVEGMIINKIESLTSKETDLLRQSYPGTDFNTCYILQEGREPAGAGKYLGFFGGGAVLLLAGLGFMLKPD